MLYSLSLFQVIGTLPLLVNPASLAGGATTPALPTQGLQVQTVSPQLLLNAQGQIIATFGNSPAQVPTSSTVLPKPTTALTLAKPASQVLPIPYPWMCVEFSFGTKMNWHEGQLRCSQFSCCDFMLNACTWLHAECDVCACLLAERYVHVFMLHAQKLFEH